MRKFVIAVRIGNRFMFQSGCNRFTTYIDKNFILKSKSQLEYHINRFRFVYGNTSNLFFGYILNDKIIFSHCSPSLYFNTIYYDFFTYLDRYLRLPLINYYKGGKL